MTWAFFKQSEVISLTGNSGRKKPKENKFQINKSKAEIKSVTARALILQIVQCKCVLAIRIERKL